MEELFDAIARLYHEGFLLESTVGSVGLPFLIRTSGRQPCRSPVPARLVLIQAMTQVPPKVTRPFPRSTSLRICSGC